MIYVIYSYINADIHSFLFQSVLPTFPREFQNRIRKYRRWQDAQSSLIGRVLLSIIIKKMKPEYHLQEILYTEYNKPFFENGNMKFNISHSGCLVICAASEYTDLGIDLELLDEINVWSYRQQMTKTEWDKVILSDNIKNSFFKYWTQKEAVIKASGQGLSLPLKSFEIVKNRAVLNNEVFLLKEIKVNNDYSCYLSVPGRNGELLDNIQIIKYVFPKN